jgi:hypothetical protein
MITWPTKSDLFKCLWIILFGAAIGITWNVLSPRGVNFRIALGLNKTPAEAGK